MDGLAAAALVAIILFFVAPPVVGAIVGAIAWKGSRSKGALAGAAGGLLIGWIAFRLVTASDTVPQSPPPDRPVASPAEPVMPPKPAAP
jgi:Na+/proline symporter